jgi:hypothetical protein
LKAHRPTTANAGRLTHGFTGDSGHAESEKQTAPSPLASERIAGTTTSNPMSAPTTAATIAPRGFKFSAI